MVSPHPFSLPISPPFPANTPPENPSSIYTAPPPRILLNQFHIYQCPLGEEEIQDFQKNPLPPPHKPDPNKEKVQRFVRQQTLSRTWHNPYKKSATPQT